MKDKLQALVDELNHYCQYGDTVGISWVKTRVLNLMDRLATEPPAVTVRKGWVCKDGDGSLNWFAAKPEWYPSHKEWATPEPTGDDWTEASCITDPWPDKPNGGPECLLEVK